MVRPRADQACRRARRRKGSAFRRASERHGLLAGRPRRRLRATAAAIRGRGGGSLRRGRTEEVGGRGKHPSGGSAWVAGRGSAEEIELARILVGLGRDCFVVAADLVVV